MIIKRLRVTFLFLFVQSFILLIGLNAQDTENRPYKNKKAEKEIEKNLMYSKLVRQVESQQFVLQPEFASGSALVYVVIDSMYAEVQNGNRRNLQGRITQYEVRKNDKKKTVSVSIKMRSVMSSADIFLYIGTYGNGSATINCDFPGNFSFDGIVVDLESANIYSGPSHGVH